MIDFFRPFLFPITVCTIVGCVWAIGWNRSMEEKIERANRPANIGIVTDDDLAPVPAVHAAVDNAPQASARD